MEPIKMFETYDQVKERAERLINTILYSADFFEHQMGQKPTIFMTRDIFDTLARGMREHFQVKAHKESNYDAYEIDYTICGYTVHLIPYGQHMLYAGYRISEPF